MWAFGVVCYSNFQCFMRRMCVVFFFALPVWHIPWMCRGFHSLALETRSVVHSLVRVFYLLIAFCLMCGNDMDMYNVEIERERVSESVGAYVMTNRKTRVRESEHMMHKEDSCVMCMESVVTLKINTTRGAHITTGFFICWYGNTNRYVMHATVCSPLILMYIRREKSNAHKTYTCHGDICVYVPLYSSLRSNPIAIIVVWFEFFSIIICTFRCWFFVSIHFTFEISRYISFVVRYSRMFFPLYIFHSLILLLDTGIKMLMGLLHFSFAYCLLRFDWILLSLNKNEVAWNRKHNIN